MIEPFERVAVVGVGLVGGSLALDLRAAGLAARLVGVDPDRENLAQALDLGVVDEAATLAEAVRGADLVVLATPPAQIGPAALAAAPHARAGAIFTDVGSIKGPIVDALRGRLPGVRFVPGHPIAGTEKSGAVAAMRDLFSGRRCILTPTDETDPDALARVRGTWEEIGAEVLLLSPDLHDRVCAAVSHLPHAAAFALTGAVGDLGQRWPEVWGLGSGGFVDTTRIAASHPEMWRDIFLLNREAVLEVVDRYLAHLAHLRRLVEAGDARALEDLLARMREVRLRVLRGD